jgi:hypothetical protein
MDAPPVTLDEIRRLGPDEPLSITVTWTSRALAATAAALSEQLDRLRAVPVEDADALSTLRAHADLAERFGEYARARAAATEAFGLSELSAVTGSARAYVERMQDGGYQEPETRTRVDLLQSLIPALCEIVSEARAVAAAADDADRMSALAP